jgi:hypothetical protein
MSADQPESSLPEPDPEPPRAPGGADAATSESDVGAASRGTPVTPDPPFSAQRDTEDIPHEIQTPEEPEEPEVGDDESTAEPSA